MLKRWIAALALILALATPVTAIDVAPGGGGSAAAGGGGAGTGTGTTGGTSTTGFGKGWFPSTFNGGGGSVVASVYQDGATVNTFHRTVACGNCLTVSTSTDGGINFVSFNTSFVVGNEVNFIIKVPSAVPRYLGYSANGGASQIFNSASLLSGWAAGVTASPDLNNSIVAAASNATGSVVLMVGGTGGGSHTNVCKSTNQGQTFGSCVDVRPASPAASVWFGGGTTWFISSADGGISRSINDGATWAVVQTLGATGGQGLCLASTSYQTCLVISAGQVFRSIDNGATYASVLSSGVSSMCDYGGGNVGLVTGVPPVGLSAITNNVFSSQDGGQNFYAGNVYGSVWTGVGAPSLSSFTCNSTGRGYMSMHTTAGPAPTFTFYNPLTQPGGVLQSSSGGYNVSALIQAGVLLNATQTSAATTAQTITLTGTGGSRVCLRNIAVFSSNAAQNVTLVVQDAAVTTFNLGTVTTTAVAGNPLTFSGQPLFCGQTGNSIQVVVGAAGAGTTTLSVVGDRYPN